MQINKLFTSILFAFSLSFVFPINSFASLKSNYIYEVTSEKGLKTYIFGSSHFLPSEAQIHLGQCVKDIFLTVNNIYIEVDQLAARELLSHPQKTMNMDLVSKYMNPNLLDSMNSEFFGPNAQGDMKQLLELDAQLLLSSIQSKIPGSTKILGQITFGLDTELMMAALFLNKKINYLETPQEQLSFFKTVSAEDFSTTIEIAFKLTRDEAAASEYYKKMLTMFEAAAIGDEAEILNQRETDIFKKYNEKIVNDRNEGIKNKISHLIDDGKIGSLFIAIGAVHLVGNDGVIQRLKSSGYKVNRLCN